MFPFQVVLDTNVLVAGLRSRRGASFELLSRVGLAEEFEINLSVPLVLEYEDVLKRQAHMEYLTGEDVDDILDFLCAVGNRWEIFFLWRPILSDPKDDMILELGVQARCSHIVTHNVSDFQGCERFRIEAATPRQFLEVME